MLICYAKFIYLRQTNWPKLQKCAIIGKNCHLKKKEKAQANTKIYWHHLSTLKIGKNGCFNSYRIVAKKCSNIVKNAIIYCNKINNLNLSMYVLQLFATFSHSAL